MQRAELLDQVGEKVVVGRTEGAKTRHSTGQLPYCLHGFITLSRRRHHALSKRLQAPSRLGQHQPAIGTNKYVGTEMFFQSQNLLGKGGLGNMQTLCGLGKRTVLDGGKKVVKLLQCHSADPSPV